MFSLGPLAILVLLFLLHHHEIFQHHKASFTSWCISNGIIS